MAIDQPLQRAPQCGNVYVGRDPRRKIDVVNRAFWRQLVKKPYALLIVRERMERPLAQPLLSKEFGE